MGGRWTLDLVVAQSEALSVMYASNFGGRPGDIDRLRQKTVTGDAPTGAS